MTTTTSWVVQEALTDATGESGLYTGSLKDGLPCDEGSLQYNNDNKKYVGFWQNGLWDGAGTLLWENGDQYQGSFVKGKQHGEGTFRWADGREYSGAFWMNLRHGKGKYVWPATGAVYEGNFVRNRRHGQGNYSDPAANVEYSGEWQGGAYHGYGHYQWRDGEGRKHAYQGHFVRGKPHGYGVEVRPDGTVRHDGQWKDGEPVKNTTSLPGSIRQTITTVVENQPWMDESCSCHAIYRGVWNTKDGVPVGNGTAEYQQGEIRSYEGCFENGLYHDHGRLAWRNGDTYEGEFRLGKRHGQGQYMWRDGRQYTGEFQDNLRHGKGKFAYANSTFYEGDFVDGKRHGVGRFVFDDGSLYDGEWKEGRYHGTGTLVHSDGKQYTGEFEAGLAHGQGKEVDLSGNVTYEGKWIRGERADLRRTTPESKPKRPAHVNPRPPSARKASPATQPGPSTTTAEASPTQRADPRDCEAVVDEEVTDQQGNPGRYTGLVLKQTRQPHGVGRLVYSDGKRIHEGFWIEGRKEGHGRCLFFPQGDFHEGEYKGNLRHGPGRYQWKDGRSFVGHYVDDLRDGKGVFEYPSGEKYEGMFAKGQRSGFGRFDFDSGKGYYTGEWVAGKYHGSGRLVWNDGMIYDGEFKAGVFHGNGVKRDKSGEVLQAGVWESGVFLGPRDEEDTEQNSEVPTDQDEAETKTKPEEENVISEEIETIADEKKTAETTTP